MDLNLSGKRALVTGGSRGIGLAISLALKSEGCKVAVFSRGDPFGLNCPFDLFLRANADEPSQRTGVMDKVCEHFGGIDILVNNVGGLGRLSSNNVEEWQLVMNRNAWAAAQFTMMAVGCMLVQGWGRVITIASVYGKEAGSTPWFNMAKSAEISLMKCLALDRRYEGITFNSVCPGPIRVGNPKESGRMGESEDVANLVAFLCSDRARWINGAAIVVDGGESRSF